MRTPLATEGALDPRPLATAATLISRRPSTENFHQIFSFHRHIWQLRALQIPEPRGQHMPLLTWRSSSAADPHYKNFSHRIFMFHLWQLTEGNQPTEMAVTANLYSKTSIN